MAVDTRDRRASLIGIGLPAPRLLPVPSGSLDSIGDRLQLSMLYRFFEDAASAASEPIEAQQAVGMSAPEPVESAGISASDQDQGVEAQSSPSSTAVESVETQQTIGAPAPGPVETQQTIETPAPGPFEAAGTSASDQDQDMEAQSFLSSMAAKPLESNEAAGPGIAAVSLEAPGLSASGAITLVEALRYLKLAGALNLESNYPTTERAAVLSMEAISGVSSAIVGIAAVDWESFRRLTILATTPVESKRALTILGGSDWEALALSSFPMLETLETLRLLSTAEQSVLEVGLRVNQTQQQRLEALLRSVESGAMPTEFTELIGSATIVIQTGRINLDVLRLLMVDGPGPLEGKRLLPISARGLLESASAPSSTGGQQAESTRLLVLEAVEAVEANQGPVGFFATTASEALRAMLALGTIPWSHSDDEQPPGLLRISGRGVLIIRKNLQAILIIARGSSGS